jgi:ribosomal protein S18 acetylase RimI-like enzyme
MTDLRFRPARPQDAASVVPLMHASSPAILDAVYGQHATAFLACDFRRGGGIFGYRHQTVGVTAGGEIVATITAYDGGRYRELALRTMGSAARSCGPVHFLRILRPAAAVGRLFVPPSRDAVFLANLCVASGHRSRGHGAALLEHVIQAGRGRGLRQAELDVSWTNARAQHLYERMGFTVITQRPDTSGRGVGGFRRMRLTIGHQG